MTGRVVLFGGAGFIGSALRAGLQGDVVAPLRREVDLLDRSALAAWLERGDVVINAAGYAAATDRSPSGLARFRRDNVEAVAVLADAAADAGVAQLIHLSSVAAMGQREGTGLREADMREPRSPYGRSKLDAELVLAARMDAVPITILRPTSIFGEGRGLARLLARVAKLPVIPSPLGGRARVPFSYVGNLVEAVNRAIGCEACLGRMFIVGDADSYPLRDILRAMAAALGHPSRRLVPVPGWAMRAASGGEALARRVIGGRPILDPIRIETLTCSVSYSIDAFVAATGYVPPVSMREAAMRIVRSQGSGSGGANGGADERAVSERG